MTDAEIIRALECCEKGFANCDGCPYDDDNNYCVTKDGKSLIIQDALYLIKRQKAEIESLESRIFALNDTNKMLIDSQEIYWKNRVKEFAERLKARIREYIFISELEFQCEEVDNLVKEMTE